MLRTGSTPVAPTITRSDMPFLIGLIVWILTDNFLWGLVAFLVIKSLNDD